VPIQMSLPEVSSMRGHCKHLVPNMSWKTF